LVLGRWSVFCSEAMLRDYFPDLQRRNTLRLLFFRREVSHFFSIGNRRRKASQTLANLSGLPKGTSRIALLQHKESTQKSVSNFGNPGRFAKGRLYGFVFIRCRWISAKNFRRVVGLMRRATISPSRFSRKNTGFVKASYWVRMSEMLGSSTWTALLVIL